MAGKKAIMVDETNKRKMLAAIEEAYTAETGTNKALKPDGSNGLVWGDATVFGTEYQNQATDGPSATALETYQDFVTLTTGSLPSGTYRVGWMYDTNLGTGDDEVEARVYDVTNITERESSNHSEADYHNFAGEWVGTLSGVTTIKIQWRRSVASTSGSVNIQWGRLEIWRVV